MEYFRSSRCQIIYFLFLCWIFQSPILWHVKKLASVAKHHKLGRSFIYSFSFTSTTLGAIFYIYNGWFCLIWKYDAKHMDTLKYYYDNYKRLFFALFHLLIGISFFFPLQILGLVKNKRLLLFLFLFLSVRVLFCKWAVGMLIVYDGKCKSWVRVLEMYSYVKFEEDIMRATSCSANPAGKGSCYKTKPN